MANFGTQNSGRRADWYVLFRQVGGLAQDLGVYTPIGSGAGWAQASLFQHDLRNRANANAGYPYYVRVSRIWQAIASAAGEPYSHALAWTDLASADAYLTELRAAAQDLDAPPADPWSPPAVDDDPPDGGNGGGDDDDDDQQIPPWAIAALVAAGIFVALRLR